MANIRLIVNGYEYFQSEHNSYTDNDVVILHNNEEIIFKPFHKEEIPKSDYEILSFHGIKNGTFEWHLGEDGDYEGYSLQRILDGYGNPDCDSVANGRIAIHSVKRIPENDVFTKGDHFMYKSREISNEISEFLIVNGVMKVKAEGVLAPMELKFISKIDKPKVPLFTTSDGKDLCFMDGYFSVSDDFHICYSNAHPKYLNEFHKERSFSTQEKAKEYILLNKPVEVSYKDIEVLFHERFGKHYDYTFLPLFKEFFKSKIQL